MKNKNHYLYTRNVHLIISLVILVLITNSCYSPPTTKKVTKSSVYAFKPTSIRKEIEPKFNIEVSKFNPEELNKETYLAARRVSNENEIETTVSFGSEQIKVKNPKSHYSTANKNIGWLKDKNIIDDRLAKELTLSYSTSYQTFDEVGTINPPKIIFDNYYPGTDNPYKQDKYSMFRVLIINESSEIKKLQLPNFIISSGIEQLYPLSIKYFDTIYSPTSTEYQNILRFNFPNEIQIPSGKTVLKFIAFPIINESNETLSLTLNRLNQTFAFDFKPEIIFQGATYNYRIFSLHPKTFFTNPEITIVVELDNKMFVLKNSKYLSIFENDITKPINIFCFTQVGHEFEFGKIENLVLSSIKNNSISIKLRIYSN